MSASSSASRTTGTIAVRCSRDASSGTTPPYLLCVASCEATTDESTVASSASTAAAVSSQEDSMASSANALVPQHLMTTIGRLGDGPRAPFRHVPEAMRRVFDNDER